MGAHVETSVPRCHRQTKGACKFILPKAYVVLQGLLFTCSFLSPCSDNDNDQDVFNAAGDDNDGTSLYTILYNVQVEEWLAIEYKQGCGEVRQGHSN